MHTKLAYGAAALVLLGPLGAFLGVLPPIAGFAVFALAGLVGLVGAIWGVVAAVRAGRPGDVGPRRNARGRALVAAGVGLVPVVLVVAMLVGGRGYPRINDVTTDLDDPPALPDRGPFPAEFAPIVRQAYADVQPLVVARPPAEVFARALALARAGDGWTVVADDAAAGTIHGFAQTRLFRFRDDFAIRVRAAGDGAVVDMRSKSRDGKGDLGVNAARIRTFLAALARDLDA